MARIQQRSCNYRHLELGEGEAAPNAPWQPWFIRGLGGLLALLLGGASVALLVRPSSEQAQASSAGVQDFLRLQQNDNCEEYFRQDRDCGSKAYWECVHDDGSWGYQCCCHHGWGDFTNNTHFTTGMISRASHPERCIDLSTPYAHVASLVPFTQGDAFVQLCNWGNPNKHFRVPRKGKGKIHWATHPKYCLGVRDGLGFDGNTLRLQRCWGIPSQWTTFIFEPRPNGPGTLIRWAANPSKCLWVSGGWDGAQLKMSTCREKDDTELFLVKPPLPKPKKDSYPLLFCLSLMLPFGYEMDLMKAQWLHGIGIFGCKDHAVYSNKSITFVNGSRNLTTDVMPGSMQVQFGGQWHTALNTDIFIRFWGKVTRDHRSWRNHWVAKLDPDAVFFAGRLQQVIASVWPDGDARKPVFLNNCHLGMHGPLEVINRHALGVYRKHWKECVKGEPYQHKQEDLYFRHCWELLHIEKINVYNLLFERAWACDERSETWDGRHPCFSKQVSFHPFKSEAAYMQCYERGAAMGWSTPLGASGEVPSQANGHHG
uniref:Ricin B lectin domain-containing protein n=1 Tax=Alexandrium monilatum TaxID=311494 RepID=A0A7S4PYV1_9DINO